jgi:hypothetical protein
VRVYHFVKQLFGLRDIERRLKIAQFMDINDPFELFSPCFFDQDTRPHPVSGKARTLFLERKDEVAYFHFKLDTAENPPEGVVRNIARFREARREASMALQSELTR